MVAYVVEQVDAVWLIAGPPLKSMDWMSPYVWEGPDKKLWMMMRGVPNPLNYEDPTGMIWCGSSDDGLTFMMDPRPVIVPGPESIDFGGVEDPTVVQADGQLFVFYTGVLASRQQGSLLLATGPDPYQLTKQEVVLEALQGEGWHEVEESIQQRLLRPQSKETDCSESRAIRLQDVSST